jgi:uncharacterized membrane protein
MSWQNQVKNIAVALAIVGGLWMALSLGIGEAVQVVIDPADPLNPLDANTTAAYGGSVDFIDRIATAGVFVTLLGSAGFGILTTSKNNPPFINTLVKYTPVIIGLVAFTAFSTEAFELISGDRVWANYSDATNGYILFLTSMMVAGIVSLLRK